MRASMGLFDIFKSRRPDKAAAGKNDDKTFWYVNRRISYAAWKRETDAFDRFAAIFERQVIEEPHAAGLMGGTRWDTSYPEILRAKVLYEKALAQLAQGDRRECLQKSVELMSAARTIMYDWHSELVNGGPRNEHSFDGKHVEAMTRAIIDCAAASRDNG
jgi:hypothetical protein